MHHDAVIAAAEAGKMIVCEKPLAMSVAEGEAMVAAVEKAGVREHGVVQLPPRAGDRAVQAVDRGRAHRAAVPLSCHVQPGLHDCRRRASGRHGPLATRFARGRLGRDRRSARPLDRHGRVAERSDQARGGPHGNVHQGTQACRHGPRGKSRYRRRLHVPGGLCQRFRRHVRKLTLCADARTTAAWR